MAIYLKYEGWDGSATAEGYKKQIKLHTAQFSTSRQLTEVQSTDDDRVVSGVEVNSMVFTKQFDMSSHAILSHIWKKEKAKDATITYLAGEGDSEGNKVMVYKLKDALCDFYECTETADAHAEESFGLTFSEIEVETFPGKKTGDEGSSKKAGYKLIEGQGT